VRRPECMPRPRDSLPDVSRPLFFGVRRFPAAFFVSFSSNAPAKAARKRHTPNEAPHFGSSVRLELYAPPFHDPEPSRSSMAAERDLLFGVMAVQAELLDEAQFAEARAAA